MSSWRRITLVIFVLVGGVAFFGYWSINQFDNELTKLDNLSALNVASVLSGSLSEKTDANVDADIDKEQTSTTTPETISAGATSTSSVSLSDKTDVEKELVSSTTPEITLTSSGTPTDLKPSFVFPQKNHEVYIGCTYKITWQSSTPINSLETALIDGGTRKASGPVASGLAKESIIESKSQGLDWKVGEVWPGEYFVSISKINGVRVEIESKFFMVNRLPEGTSASEKENICKESGGLF